MRIVASRIDWSEIVFDLERQGLTQREIARRCDVSGHSWVNNLKNIPGTEPRFHDGAMLLGLWVEITERDPAEAPKT